MCQIYAGQDPSRFEYVTRSVRLSGHATSLKLEAAFWTILDELAAKDGITTPKLLSQLYNEVLELRGEVYNFTSLLRTTCLLYIERSEASEGGKAPATSLEDRQALMGSVA